MGGARDDHQGAAAGNAFGLAEVEHFDIEVFIPQARGDPGIAGPAVEIAGGAFAMALDEVDHGARGLGEGVNGAAEQGFAAEGLFGFFDVAGGVDIFDEVGGGHGLVAFADMEDHAFGIAQAVLARQLLGPGQVAVRIDEFDRDGTGGGGIFLKQDGHVAVRLVGGAQDGDDADVVHDGPEKAQAFFRELRDGVAVPVEARVVAHGEVIEHDENGAGEQAGDGQVGMEGPAPEAAGGGGMGRVRFHGFQRRRRASRMRMDRKRRSTVALRYQTMARVSMVPAAKSSMWTGAEKKLEICRTFSTWE